MDESARWTQNVSFPATKQELIDAAVEWGVPQELIERLQQLDREQYESRDELEAELGEDV